MAGSEGGSEGWREVEEGKKERNIIAILIRATRTNKAFLALLEAVLLASVEQVGAGLAEVDDLRAP